MLVRFVLDNIYSFGKRKEFTTIPNTRLGTLKDHIYSHDNFEFLKLTSIYGANGAGKSNLVKALKFMQLLVTSTDMSQLNRNNLFKFTDNKKQTLVIEFIQDSQAYIYGLEIEDNIILVEELYLSGLGKTDDRLLFERKTENEETKIKFFDQFETNAKSNVLKEVLIEEFVSFDKPIFKLLAHRENEHLKDIKHAYAWFENTLNIISPMSKPLGLAIGLEKDKKFKDFAERLLRSFNIGIESIKTESIDIKQFFGQDNSYEIAELISEVDKTRDKVISFLTRNDEEITVVKENDKYLVKRLKLTHVANEKAQDFTLEEESDGTNRLLDLIPAFKNILSHHKVIIVDEIERSIHPLLIKELIRKFSEEKATKGQLIFTTHESNLLDQSIFRQDEIWFSEKDAEGSTDLYSLSDFKEHKTIDIRKGYLFGRYGSIPFLGNLQDLNWVENDIKEQGI